MPIRPGHGGHSLSDESFDWRLLAHVPHTWIGDAVQWHLEGQSLADIASWLGVLEEHAARAIRLYLPEAELPKPREPAPRWGRNAAIFRSYRAGETQASLAEAYGISVQRVSQIVARQRELHAEEMRRRAHDEEELNREAERVREMHHILWRNRIREDPDGLSREESGSAALERRGE